jgi:hypothetical protein
MAQKGVLKMNLCTVCELIDIAPDVDWLEGVRQTHLFKDDRDFLPVGRVPARHTHTPHSVRHGIVKTSRGTSIKPEVPSTHQV